MAVWTSESYTDYLENAIVTYKYRDGLHTITEIKANKGYALTDVNYTPEYDEGGNEMPRLYHLTICTPPSIDYNLYESVSITEDMEVA